MTTATITTRRRTIKPDSPRARWTLRQQIADRHGWLCHWCSRPLNENDGRASNELYATIEHLIPRSQGGTNDLDNLRLACRRCNNERHANVARVGGDARYGIADAARVIEWARSTPRKAPSQAFTDGPERQAAYWIEWAWSNPPTIGAAFRQP